jgi:hypothetical protein
MREEEQPAVALKSREAVAQRGELDPRRISPAKPNRNETSLFPGLRSRGDWIRTGGRPAPSPRSGAVGCSTAGFTGFGTRRVPPSWSHIGPQIGPQTHVRTRPEGSYDARHPSAFTRKGSYGLTKRPRLLSFLARSLASALDADREFWSFVDGAVSSSRGEPVPLWLRRGCMSAWHGPSGDRRRLEHRPAVRWEGPGAGAPGSNNTEPRRLRAAGGLATASDTLVQRKGMRLTTRSSSICWKCSAMVSSRGR